MTFQSIPSSLPTEAVNPGASIRAAEVKKLKEAVGAELNGLQESRLEPLLSKQQGLEGFVWNWLYRPDVDPSVSKPGIERGKIVAALSYLSSILTVLKIHAVTLSELSAGDYDPLYLEIQGTLPGIETHHSTQSIYPFQSVNAKTWERSGYARTRLPARKGPYGKGALYLQAALQAHGDRSERHERARTVELVGDDVGEGHDEVPRALELDAGSADEALERLVGALAVGHPREHAILVSIEGAGARVDSGRRRTQVCSPWLASYIERRQIYYFLKGSHRLASQH
ncbi:hypothetical protein MRS44_017543 [Fusarium solani]|uniref:uncharacterized protein n=1 Tax=Fusarium solani TaxID=169388 RepID=UPI0032C42299|nr:hypothetical protein MRS44_017543 [Fusarium solani]